MDVAIAAVAAGDVPPLVPALAGLLQDAVEGGASVGFLPPLAVEEASGYWRGVAAAIGEGRCVLLVAGRGDGSVVGTVQLALEPRANGRHRRRWRSSWSCRPGGAVASAAP